MRKVMADIVAEASQFIETPNAASKIMKIPEAASGNSGRSGIVPVGSHIRSKQSMEVEVEKSGTFPSFRKDDGARFKIKFDELLNDDGDEVCDDYTWTGAERGTIPGYVQQLTDEVGEAVLTSPRLLELEKWKNLDSSKGLGGLLGVTRESGGVVSILFYVMWEYNDFGGLASDEMSYEWEQSSNRTLTSGITGAALTPSFDMVEMEDGSIVVALYNGDGEIMIYRSFDTGTNWMYLGDAVISGLNERNFVSLNRIGSRLVLVYASHDGADTNVYSRYSDDGGFTWSGAVAVYQATVAADLNYTDMVMGQDGVLYLMVVSAGTIWTVVTLDGVNWDTPSNSAEALTGNMSFFQKPNGRWEMYYVKDDDGYMIPSHGVREASDNPRGGYSPAANSAWLCRNAGDTDGMDSDEVAARTFLNGGYTDVAVIWHDDHSGTDFYSLQVIRTSMWSGLQVEFDNEYEFGACWFPHGYPSTNDGHPNMNFWSEAQGGDGACDLEVGGNFRHLEITANTGFKYYSLANGDGNWPAEMWVAGFTMRFEMQVVKGYAKIRGKLNSNGNNKDVDFVIVFSTTKILLLDVNNVLTVLADITPTNWNPTEWNEYLLVAKQNEVELRRAPSGVYREIQPYEVVFDVDNLTEIGYTSDTDRIDWGYFSVTGYDADSESNWRTVMAMNTGGDINWDEDTECIGERCHANPVGIMQGFGAKFSGDWALEDDSWDMDTGAQYQGENIFLPSPRQCWKEPVQTAGNPDRVFIWERSDVDDQEMNFTFDAISMFNINSFQFKLEGENFGGGGATTLYDSTIATGNQGANRLHTSALVVSAIDNNVITVGYGGSNIDTEFIPGQFASNDYRNWYIYMYDGTKTGQVYRILNNTGTKLLLERNAEDDGVAATDQFILYGDRFFHRLNFASCNYPRLTLTIENGGTVYLSDNQARLGTIIIGTVYDLPDDEWEFGFGIGPNVNSVKARTGVELVREQGQEQRTVSLQHTGLIDRSMGIESARELYRLCRWGVSPVVWIDHGDAMGGRYDVLAFPEPILARMMSEYNQQHRAYNYLNQNGDNHVRNILESSLMLQEVL